MSLMKSSIARKFGTSVRCSKKIERRGHARNETQWDSAPSEMRMPDTEENTLLDTPASRNQICFFFSVFPRSKSDAICEGKIYREAQPHGGCGSALRF